MRTIFQLFLLCLFFLPYGCATSEASDTSSIEARPVVVTGRVTGAEEPIPLVYSTRYVQGFSNMEDDGVFEFTFESDQPEIFSISYQFQRWHVFAIPGDSIYLEFDHFDMLNFGQPIQYKGDHAEDNKSLNRLRTLLQYGEQHSRMYYESQDDFALKLAKTLVDFQNYAENEILSNENLSTEFRSYAIGYGHILINLHLELYFRNQQSPDRDLSAIRSLREQLPASFKSHTLSEFGATVLNVAPYRTLQVRSIYNELMQERELNPVPNPIYGIEKAYELTSKVQKNADIREGIRFEILRGHYGALGFSTIEDLTDDFIKEANNALYIASIHESQEQWKFLSGQDRAPRFSLPDLHGSLYNLDSFRGKSLYIDVWATWCGPCLDERPHFENLMSDYQDSDKISFVGISIDRDTVAWSKMIQFHEMKGLQLYAGVESSFREDYQIRPIPHFLLIDKDGYIIDYDAPRPSSEEIRERIESLIQ